MYDNAQHDASAFDAAFTSRDGALLTVHHRTRDYAIIEKPAGLLSVPGRGAETDPKKFDSVATRVASMFPEADGSIIVHRLDMETSGLMVVGLTRAAHRMLSRQFEQREVDKTYVALLDGHIDADEGAIDLPLLVDWPNRPRQKVDYEQGRPARTLYRVIERDAVHNSRTRVQFMPITGRSHQLRVHAATPIERGGLGAPIAGDTLYGNAASAPRLLLHAAQLAIREPASGARMKFTSPPPF